MRILLAASEFSPLAKVGGLGDVIGSLPRALVELGHDVRVVIPQYGCIDFGKYKTALKGVVEIESGGRAERANINELNLEGLHVYLVENAMHFSQGKIYTDYDLPRFLYFSRAVYRMLHSLEWQPEIVHCHDWQTALIIRWLKTGGFHGASIFTIHNLAYQGVFDDSFLTESGLHHEWNHIQPAIPPAIPLNFMAQGILWADVVTTVSETYAKEILTQEQGAGLESLLRYRQKDLLGITNGIDYREYDPSVDPYIPEKYDSDKLENRAINKHVLQKLSNLDISPEVPLIGMVQRLDEQKGFDILEKALPLILKQTGAQLVVLGTGREHYESMLRRTAQRFPGRMALYTRFDGPLAHLIYSGSDLFLMPSRFEPCGLGQLIAMRYGALPIVRHTGGLIDTVPEITPDLLENNGFVFHQYDFGSLKDAVDRGTRCYTENRFAWNKAVKRVMDLDFSWRTRAPKYDLAYKTALRTSHTAVAPQFCN